jgi:hypothetical protein
MPIRRICCLRLPDQCYPKWATFGCGDDQPVRAGWIRGEVFGDFLSEPGCDGDGSACGWRLWFGEAEMTADFAEGAFDPDEATVGVGVAEVECGDFTEPASDVCGNWDHGPIVGIDGVGELGDFVGGEEPYLRAFDSWQGDVAARRADNQSCLHCV